MKKRNRRLTALCAATLMMFGFTSCGNSNSFPSSTSTNVSVNPSSKGTSSTEVCKHVFDQKVVDEKYKATEATCDFPATYYYSCKCGKKGTEVFEHGEALGHDWTEWFYSYRDSKDGIDYRSRKCKRCGKIVTEEVKYANNLYFSVTDEKNRTAQVLGYREFYGGELDTEINIPETWNGYTITKIANQAFKELAVIKSVTFPKSVTEIGESAFESCKNLETIVIPDDSQLETIGNSSFYNCQKLSFAFNCPATIKYLGDKSFSYTSITSLRFNSAPEFIGNASFSNSSIGGELIIPANVGRIATGAFSRTQITSLVIEGQIDTLNRYAFSSNTLLKKVIIKEGQKTVGTDMFAFCTNLESVSLPSSIETIYKDAFYNCTSLTSLTLPKSVNDIGAYILGNCSALISLTVEQGNEIYYSKDNCLIDKNNKKLIFACSNGIIPTDDSVAVLASSSFSVATTSVIIPTSVTTIEDWAFDFCTNLTNVYYMGTEEQFKKIVIGGHNDPFKKANIQYNYKA